jgi:hypothetical protein
MGSFRAATVSADCTSSAAPSMFRLRSNWMTTELTPSAEVDVSEVMPAMVESARSIGPATEAPMVSALAPGSVAVIWMVGKSTAGNAATASRQTEHDQRCRDQRRHYRAADASLGNIHVTPALR